MRRPEDELAALRNAGLLRELRRLDPAPLPCVRLDGREIVNFSSNDYLGLSQHPEVVRAARGASECHGAGSTASRLVCGSLGVHHELEARIAGLKRTEAALTFSSGYAAAVGTLTALLERGDTVILDKLCHASLIDGARLSAATMRVYPHNHLGKLGRLLAAAREAARPDRRVLVVTESVFSMEGDRAPLAEIADLAERFGAELFVDEAHALGVFGAAGQGLAEELGVQERVTIQMGTLGKAAGAAGGYIAAARPWIDLVLNKARSLIFSTAPPPGQAAAALAGMNVLASPEGDELRATLHRNLAQFAALTGRTGHSAILPVVIGDNRAALAASRALLDAGFLVPAIRYPSVPRGSARLRVTLSAAHRAEHLEGLARALGGLNTGR